MTVTILLAAYQGERFLPALLDSLSGQTESRFRVLYQDDGSSDSTPELLAARAKADPRFHPAAEQGKHLGAAGNFLSLLRQAEGDLILFCDQDDIWKPEKLACLLKAYEDAASSSSPGPLLIHSDASLIGENDQEICPSFFRLQGWDPGAVSLNRLLVQNNVTGCTMLLNRPLADLAARYGNPDRIFMHDWFISMTAAAFGRIRFVDLPLVCYRQHAGNTIGASRSSLLQRGIRALKERDQAKARIDLTYTNAERFLEAYDDVLPSESREVITRYLSLRSMPKAKRVMALRRYGYLMQSPVTRAGQLLFG